MANFKLVIGLKGGKCVQKEIKDQHAQVLIGKKIGDLVKGEEIGLSGYEFMITGGSDYCGFPMRKDVVGLTRKRVLAVRGTIGLTGWRSYKKRGKVLHYRLGKGIRYRKTVCGNAVNDKTVQINLKAVKEGVEPIIHEPSKKE
ncbi:30S ribosomal protein S6e [Candidatus Woesearchaeota archaeon]|nr:30S ribosomal protein S6e [Candidatus Woesearchaeota archaeon]